MSTTILLLAAGASTRMGGRDKLLEDVGGQPLLRDRAQVCLASNADHVRVVLSPDVPNRRAALNGLEVDIFETSGAHLGLSHSLQTGVTGLHGSVMILLADLPDITTDDLNAMLAAAHTHPEAKIIRGTTETGKPGHPVLLSPEAVRLIDDLTGDEGLKKIVHFGERGGENYTHFVQFDGKRALTDLDTPEDWAAWRASSPKG